MKSGCHPAVLLLAALAAFQFVACGRSQDPAKAAKSYLAPGKASTVDPASALGSERYLPADDRLHRRQQRIRDSLTTRPR